jgi:peptidoglycan/xylan/chitin deacetylase (PgdA/CDA1 family)
MVFAPIFYLFSFFTLLDNNANVIVTAKNYPTKYIYLTFDDGPLFGTANCIDICTHEQVKATFFEVGLHQSRSDFGKALYNRILENKDFFDLCNHSFTHANNKYLYFYHHPIMAFEDFIKSKHSLMVSNNIVRLPGNAAWNTTLLKKSSNLVSPLVHKLDSAGLNVIGWDVEWRFNEKALPIGGPQKIVNMIDAAFAHNRTMTKDHLVILMHDHMFRTSADSTKLATMIGLIKANPNYSLRKISEYPGLINGGR